MKIILLIFLTLGSALAQTAQRKELGALETKFIRDVLNKNDELFNAFLVKDGEKVENKSTELYKIISKTDFKLFAGLKKESIRLLNVKSQKSHESNLAEYEGFLKPLIDVVRSYNVGDKFNVFHCPMVQKSWIQNVAINKEVKNVYAMEMLECGTQETKF